MRKDAKPTSTSKDIFRVYDLPLDVDPNKILSNSDKTTSAKIFSKNNCLKSYKPNMDSPCTISHPPNSQIESTPVIKIPTLS